MLLPNKYFMIIFEYLDWLPKIPDEFIQFPAERTKENLIYFGSTSTADNGFNRGYRGIVKQGTGAQYIRWRLRSEFQQWIRDNITESFDLNASGLQALKVNSSDGHFKTHTDARKWVLNYIFETGGDDVWTSFYSCDNKLLQTPDTKSSGNTVKIFSTKVEKNRWCLLNAHVYHDVFGITHTRNAISLGLVKGINNPYEHLHPYKHFFGL